MSNAKPYDVEQLESHRAVFFTEANFKVLRDDQRHEAIQRLLATLDAATARAAALDGALERIAESEPRWFKSPQDYGLFVDKIARLALSPPAKREGGGG